MGRNLKLLLAAALALAIAACTSEQQQSSNPTPTAPAVTKKSQPFNNPVVPPKQTPVVNTTANLIRPTDPNERVEVVLKGRVDPFAQIVGQYPAGAQTNTVVSPKPVPVLPPLRRQPAVRPTVPTRRVVAIRTRIPTRAGKPQIRITASKNPLKLQKNKIALVQKKAQPKLPRVFTPVLPKVLPQVIPNPTLASVLPPPPQPELAKAILVSGVVLIGREPQAIIKVPDEPTSRYVQAGLRLANGVLVKRIEMNEGSNPVLILEQYGIEVARTVGEAPTASTPKAVSVTSPPPNPVPTGAS